LLTDASTHIQFIIWHPSDNLHTTSSQCEVSVNVNVTSSQCEVSSNRYGRQDEPTTPEIIRKTKIDIHENVQTPHNTKSVSNAYWCHTGTCTISGAISYQVVKLHVSYSISPRHQNQILQAPMQSYLATFEPHRRRHVQICLIIDRCY
jgi:hypothetical protein